MHGADLVVFLRYHVVWCVVVLLAVVRYGMIKQCSSVVMRSSFHQMASSCSKTEYMHEGRAAHCVQGV